MNNIIILDRVFIRYSDSVCMFASISHVRLKSEDSSCYNVVAYLKFSVGVVHPFQMFLHLTSERYQSL